MVKVPMPGVTTVHNVLRLPETTQHTLQLTSHHLLLDSTSIAYSLLLHVARLPANRTDSRRIYPIAIYLKTFESCTLAFANEADQLAVYSSVKQCAVLDDLQQLYAFQQPAGHHPVVYNVREEFARQGVGSHSSAWRFTNINASYTFCDTYPAQLVVPARISDTTLTYAAKYRSRERVPALTYLHWANQASITRSSQPMVGIKNARSIQDEKLIEAIFTVHEAASPAKAVYGSTSTNLIIDARPTTNAMANVAKGAGTENMEYYKGCKKAYLGIDNIHVMRDSLDKVVHALRDGEGVDSAVLRRSGWLKHLQSLMMGSMAIVRNVHINSSHVLIHCSDGWDRTSQLAAIAQLCLDPYYRTFDGLAVLIEKDWLSFGHKFSERSGHLGCNKYFVDKYSGEEEEDGDSEVRRESKGPTLDSAANAFWGFTKQLTANFSGPAHRGAHIKETSPVFQQFLECIWQIMRQFPTRFEYSAGYLVELHRTVHECKYGTFLLNCERERMRPESLDGRVMAGLATQTPSAWVHLLSDATKARFANAEYAVGERGDGDVLLADAQDVEYFTELWQ